MIYTHSGTTYASRDLVLVSGSLPQPWPWSPTPVNSPAVQSDFTWLPGSRVLLYRANDVGGAQLHAVHVASDGAVGTPHRRQWANWQRCAVLSTDASPVIRGATCHAAAATAQRRMPLHATGAAVAIAATAATATHGIHTRSSRKLDALPRDRTI